ncbi:helix-turn-helix domain-containing protein [Paenibacillus albidus]|uniref:helix-turn-helix domain-containing protein n=1 Tax=Paenibacillus albidus TaxID=2041023 RepID=UPI001BE51902|nr:AraC family transcriptional regulator [Paenibacillus albidus]MBT2292846.1 helix-turn-helix domain-containing protein [Paenibacillus albidus]
MDRVLYIVSAAHEPNTYIPPHQHECYELVYYIHALGSSNVGARNYHFRSASFALIPPNFKHDEKHTPGAELLFVGFICDHPNLSALSGVYEDDKEQTVLQILLRMKAEFSRKQDGFTELMNLQMSEIIVHLLRLLGAGHSPSPSEDRVQYVLNYMDEHYRNKLSVKTLSDMSGYSYDRFRHIFKERFGLSPLRYLLLKRLDYAKSLLRHTQMPISEISANAGFVNDAQFCNMFKREIGLTPRKFRVSNKAK